MSEPARKIRTVGEAEYRDEAEARLAAPGDAALVRRGELRSLILKCPDGCGQTLVVNLDKRAGKAWRLDLRGGEVTLYPSVWREGGCGSHFIVWRGKILWCDRFERGNIEPSYDPQLEERLYAILDPQVLRSSEDLADELDEIPWEISRVGRRLVHAGKAECGRGNFRDWFKKASQGQ